MVILKILTIFIIAINVFSIEIKKVDISCNQKVECNLVEDKFNELINKNITENQLYTFIEYELDKSYYKNFYFSLKDNTLYVDVEIRDKIKQITFQTSDKLLRERLVEVIGIRKGDYLDEVKIQEGIGKIQSLYFDETDNALNFNYDFDEEGTSLYFVINDLKLKKLKKLKINGLDNELLENSNAYWRPFFKVAWDKLAFKRNLDLFKNNLENLGYWQLKIEDEIHAINSKDIEVIVNVNLGPRYGISFNGVKYFEHQDIIRELKKTVVGLNEILSTDSIVQTLSGLYRKKGVFYSLFNTRLERGTDSHGAYLMYFIDITEGQKVKINEIVFSGNYEIPDDQLFPIFDKHSSDLISKRYLDIDNLEKISSFLREYYVSKGYVFSTVETPLISFGEDENTAFVTYKIVENSSYRVSDIKIRGVKEEEIVKEIEGVISNKQGEAFNVTEVDTDLKKAIEIVKQNGYFFTSYKIKNPKEIIELNNADKTATINISFDTGKKSFMGDLLITGNQVTKDMVIQRELRIEKGDIVTPDKINDFVNRLRSLGLFSTVNITPFIGKNIDKDSIYLNFIVKVKEKEFGRGEVAPGYRTDLGYKLSMTTSYNNWKGKNRSWITKVQANYRTSLSDLDEKRKLEDKKMLEGIVQLQYIEPYMFYKYLKTPLELRTSLKYQRRRYHSFDADIVSFSPSFNKEFTDYFQFNLRYEFDVINQFSATNEIDNDSYKIGAITPTFTLDFRDNHSSPRSGAWFNFSWEFANPYFASQSDDELTINYNRALLRSYFYTPMWKTTLATSITLGAEKNFANEKLYQADGSPKIETDTGEHQTRGYIPSLKVFRLSGVDVLRGFSDSESNRLIDGSALSDSVVRESAYLVNFKIENRYYIDDTSVIALFFDAGRVFLDSVDLKELRKSVGLSFKLLTPVGSLDFDYGLKLKRESYDAKREQIGKFHVTIGQF